MKIRELIENLRYLLVYIIVTCQVKQIHDDWIAIFCVFLYSGPQCGGGGSVGGEAARRRGIERH